MFGLALALPTVVLVYTGFQRLASENLQRHRLQAEALVTRINRRAEQWVEREQARSFAEYSFLVVSGDADANFVQRSTLSELSPADALPGAVGYFQVDASGALTTPLLPTDADNGISVGLSSQQFELRRARERQLRELLDQPAVATEGRTQPLADAADGDDSLQGLATQTRPEAAGPRPRQSAARLASARSTSSVLEDVYAPAEQRLSLDAEALVQSPAPAVAARAPASAASPAESVARRRPGQRAEKVAVPAARDAPTDTTIDAVALQTNLPVETFDALIDPLVWAPLADGVHVMLLRRVWQGGKRFFQGVVVRESELLRAILEAELDGTAGGLRVLAERHGRPVAEAGVPIDGAVQMLYERRLAAPLDAYRLRVLAGELPTPPGFALLVWTSAVLVLVLAGGLALMYRYARSQLALQAQQQAFVSAVSHELKTPLTSIRMYAEMLREGWADESRRRTYYDFILSESERLSRLIANVLQLSRLGRNVDAPRCQRIDTATLMDAVRQRIASQVALAGFELVERHDAAVEVLADQDAVIQVVINLVDNALKFAAGAQRRELHLTSSVAPDAVTIGVRDFGPGVPDEARARVFELFYRGGDEMTRETPGTGIGLALVQRLVTAMGGRVTLEPCQPGARFAFTLRRAPD